MKKNFFLFSAVLVMLLCTAAAGGPVYALAGPVLKADTVIVRFKINGAMVKGKDILVGEGVSMTGVYGIGFTSVVQGGKDRINIAVTGDTAGVYPVLAGSRGSLTKGIAYGNYQAAAKDGRAEPYSFDSGRVTVVSFNKKSRRVSFRFSGKMKNQHGDVLEITDGELINGWVKPRDKNAIN